MAAAVELASSTHLQEHGKLPQDAEMPALVEVAHEIRFHAENTAEHENQNQCCPCSQEDVPAY